MSEAVVFNGLNSLDFYDVRKNVCRIPEVITKVREAQEFLESTDLNLDLLNFIGSEDKTFLNQIRFKSLAACIVQLGLYDRYRRFHDEPTYFVGNINGDSAVQVACGVLSFSELLKRSPALAEAELPAEDPSGLAVLEVGREPVLKGFSIAEYAIFTRLSETNLMGETAGFSKLEIEPQSVDKLIHKLVEEEQLKKVINIGPGNILVSRKKEDLILDQITISESIDVDPMLSWFWPSLKECMSIAI